MSFNFMAAVTICNDFGAQKNKVDFIKKKKNIKMIRLTEFHFHIVVFDIDW